MSKLKVKVLVAHSTWQPPLGLCVSPCGNLLGIHVPDENQHSRRYGEHVRAHYKTKVNAKVHCFVEQTTCTVDSQLHF